MLPISPSVKYRLSACLAAAGLFCAAAAYAGTTSFREDFNGDGRVDASDVVYLMRQGRDNPYYSRYDLNGDGRFSLLDAVAALLRIAGGKLTPFESSAWSWSRIGFGGGGAMFIPTVDPFDPSHVVLASDMTGAFVTTDNAASWNNFNLRTVVNDFEFDPSTPGRVYAINTGLYRSDDGGASWNLIYPTRAKFIEEKMTGDHADHWFRTTDGDNLPEWGYYKVKVDPSDPQHVIIARFPPWMGQPWLIVTHDGGVIWSKVAELPQPDVLEIYPGAWWDKPDEWIVVTAGNLYRFDETGGALDSLAPPQTPIVAASGGLAGSKTGSPVLYLLGTRLYRSTDIGATWSAAGISGLPSGGAYNIVEACAGQAETLYLGCSNVTSNGQFGTLKSTDSGDHWAWVYRADGGSVLTGNYSNSWMDRTYGPSWRGGPLSLGVSPTNPDVCYATDAGGAYRTLDGGVRWEEVYSDNQADGTYSSRGLNVTAQYGIIFDPADTNRILAPCTDVGMFASDNRGVSWSTAVSGIPSEWRNTCYWAQYDPQTPGRVWGAWTNCHDLPRDKMMRSGMIQRGEYRGGVALSDDSGRHWKMSNAGLPASTICTHIILDPFSPAAARVLYVCGFGSGVYKSVDGGMNWSLASSGLPAKPFAWRIVLRPDGSLILLVARGWTDGVTIDGALYRSDNGAASWTKIDLPAGYNFPNDLVFDPSDPQVMYLCCWATEDRTVEPWMERRGGVLKTTDDGRSWTQVFEPQAHVYSAALDPQRPSTVVITTFNSGAFRSDDSGKSWYRLQGFDFKWAYRPIFDPRDSEMLYITTFGGGIYRGPSSGVPGALEDIVNDDQFFWQGYKGTAPIRPGL